METPYFQQLPLLAVVGVLHLEQQIAAVQEVVAQPEVQETRPQQALLKEITEEAQPAAVVEQVQQVLRGREVQRVTAALVRLPQLVEFLLLTQVAVVLGAAV